MAPRRLENRSKMPPGGLPGASREPELIFDALLVSLGALLGAPGALLGSSWGLLGRSRAVPGGHFGRWAVTFRSYLEGPVGSLARGMQQKAFVGCFSVLLYAGLGLILLSSLAFRAAPPTAKRSLKKHEKPCVFSIRLLGCPCCGKCKENNFQSTGARKTKRKTSERTTPATIRRILPKSSQNGPNMVPKSLQNRSRQARETPRDAKSRPREAKNNQERPKSVPTAIFLRFCSQHGPATACQMTR